MKKLVSLTMGIVLSNMTVGQSIDLGQRVRLASNTTEYRSIFQYGRKTSIENAARYVQIQQVVLGSAVVGVMDKDCENIGSDEFCNPRTITEKVVTLRVEYVGDTLGDDSSMKYEEFNFKRDEFSLSEIEQIRATSGFFFKSKKNKQLAEQLFSLEVKNESKVVLVEGTDNCVYFPGIGDDSGYYDCDDVEKIVQYKTINVSKN